MTMVRETAPSFFLCTRPTEEISSLWLQRAGAAGRSRAIRLPFDYEISVLKSILVFFLCLDGNKLFIIAIKIF